MTDRERYRRAFSAIQPSAALLEGMTMEKTNRNRLPARRLLVLCTVLVLIISVFSVAYATDLGGFRIWVNGKLQSGAIDQSKDGSITWTSEDGTYVVDGGYIVLPDGSERPITAEELMEEYRNNPVLYTDKGVIVAYQDQRYDITEEMQRNNRAVVEFEINGEAVSWVVTRIDEKCNFCTDPNINGYDLRPLDYEPVPGSPVD